MPILLFFAFIAGIVTILSPCILPVLPIVLSGTVGGGKRRPFGIVVGFILTFTFFTLFLTAIVKALGIPADILRIVSIIIVGFFGLSFLIPGFQKVLERLFSRLSSFAPKNTNGEGFFSGILMGFGIGMLWTPCVGPILASVIALAASGAVTIVSVAITIAYSLGTALPMLGVLFGGRTLLNRIPWLSKNTAKIQKVFGIVMILTAVGIFFNYDRAFQTFILTKFPNYGTNLTKIEDNSAVQNGLESIKGGDTKNMLNLNLGLSDYGSAPEIIPGGEWFNLPEGQGSLKISDLRGKVVLVDFWTYTCINCIRTLPYIKAWDEKYRDMGLVVIGVHTPEFEFEKSAENVKKAISDFGLEYPIVQDNNYATWNAYTNHYWPAKYLVDKDGKIRYTHFGEGDYDKTEEVIQSLLKEAGAKVSEKIDNQSYEVDTKTPETYLGYGRMGYFADPSQVEEDAKSKYMFPKELALNHFAYDGVWTVNKESAMADLGAKLAIAFDAKDVFLVMKPQNPGVKVKVLLDEKDIASTNAGEDVSGSFVTLSENRLYKLVHLALSGQHTLTLEFVDGGVEVFAFTFG